MRRMRLWSLFARYRRWVAVGIACAASAFAATAEAHTSERAFILLLPTHLYIVGGTLVVALSFAVMALAPAAGLRALGRARWRVGRLPRLVGRTGPSLASLAVALALIAAGRIGSPDPLANPLPLAVWTVWWVGLTFLHAVFGNLWAVLNPWSGAYRLITALPGLRRWRARPPLSYPRRLGHWPSVVVLFAFAWLELVDPAPQDPLRLALIVAAYLAATFCGMLLFGERVWRRYAEAFSVFFRLVSWLSPFELAHGSGRRGGPELSVTLPGLRLVGLGALAPGLVGFVLLALASVSFDGLSRTFWWLALVGENPLEYPGRTALLGVNTFGLLATYGALAAVYTAAVLAGRALGAAKDAAGAHLRRFVVSIVPIAFGYHFAHYLPATLVDLQYALRAASDPFARGWNLFGTADWRITASFLTSADWVRLLWNLQVAGIVAAHVAAIVIAHLRASEREPDARRVVVGQIPMTALMIGYTLFGLWLLATPAVG